MRRKQYMGAQSQNFLVVEDSQHIRAVKISYPEVQYYTGRDNRWRDKTKKYIVEKVNILTIFIYVVSFFTVIRLMSIR